jgi:hypothetical protein
VRWLNAKRTDRRRSRHEPDEPADQGEEETTMSMTDRPTRGPARRGPYVIVGVLIAIGIVVPLLVPTYASATPTFIGLPFFYWYQMLWVLIDTALLAICFAIISREDRRRRAAVHGGSGRGAAGERPAARGAGR